MLNKRFHKAMASGLETLQEYIRIAPARPGVYRMLGAGGKVLYVGKAKNIAKRISAYSHFEKLDPRLQRMVAQIESMEFVVAENEAKALLLENELIKKLKPKYNILLRDDKTFPNLSIDLHEEFPVLRKQRGKAERGKGAKVFGPFANAGAVNEAMDVLQKAFLLRSCSEGNFKSRTRPCVLHQIKRCSAPCAGRISRGDYAALARQAVDFLEGRDASLQQELSAKMAAASAAQDYEQAAVCRDRIRALASVRHEVKVEYAGLESADVVGIFEKGGRAAVSVFFIRGGQHCGNNTYFPEQAEGVRASEILEAFISSFYARHEAPKEIIASEAVENAEFLAEAIGAKIGHYAQGGKAVLARNAVENARERLTLEMASRALVDKNLEQMRATFGLAEIPRRIEVYDNSHLQGSHAVGAYVVAVDGVLDKRHYRKFDIKNPAITNDDFAMMKEVLARRFARLIEENRPDAVLIDGGAGQLGAVLEALSGFDLTGTAVIAMAKGEERNAGKEVYHIAGREPFSLPFASPLAFFLQNLRDEAHRFAIGTHRAKRAKSVSRSRLDGIPGIGAKRKRELLNRFGSAEQVSQAGIGELAKVIGKKTAEKIYSFFHC